MNKTYSITVMEESTYFVYAENLKEAKEKALKCDVDLTSQNYIGMKPIISSIRRYKLGDEFANKGD